MDSFISSRREDPSVKERERALQSLDLSYHDYKKTIRHLDEGIQVRLLRVSSPRCSQVVTVSHQFYNDLTAILIRFKEECVEWVMGRRSELK
jgi:programmed cell death 6-interacting protein